MIMDLKEPDRIRIPCKNCFNRGWVQTVLRPPISVFDRDYSGPIAETELVKTAIIDCPNCFGRGFITPKDGERVPVFQGGRKLGTCTVPARVRTSMLVDQRPGDYKPVLINDEMAYEASWTLGYGDIERLEGFRWD